MIKSQTLVREIETDYEAELNQMQERLHKKEQMYQKTIDELRKTYGTKITELTTTVEGLRKQLER